MTLTTSQITVSVRMDLSSECLKRLCDSLTAAVKPNGGYRELTTDDVISGESIGEQQVGVEWWLPEDGCDSLENTLDSIKGRLLVAVQDWLPTALTSATCPPAPSEAVTLAAELRHFIAERKKMRGLDPETIYSIHEGEAEKEAHLRVSRLLRMAELLEQLRPQPQSPELTDEELIEPIMWMIDECVYDNDKGEIAQSLRELITRSHQFTHLPSNYIDPGHTDQDRELLEIFYSACQSEGGTADEIHLMGIRAVLAARALPDQPVLVSERLPEPEDCDSEGKCWVECPAFVDDGDHGSIAYNPSWELCRCTPSVVYDDTRWLPHYALPIPEAHQ
jgi:hypothetical protein